MDIATNQSSKSAGSSSFSANLPPGWRTLLIDEETKPYFRRLASHLANENAAGQLIYPPPDKIFRALQLVDYDAVRVVILGQDPYHGPDQAVGLAFAVPNDHRPKPPSLTNIYKELADDLKGSANTVSSDLTSWAKQGVLLLNTALTVRAGQAFSHRDFGWETFTDRIIALLNARKDPIVFILWGSAAQKKKSLITASQHRCIESVHPSPLSAYRGFFGSKPFSKANDLLAQWGQTPIDWLGITADQGHSTRP